MPTASHLPLTLLERPVWQRLLGAAALGALAWAAVVWANAIP